MTTADQHSTTPRTALVTGATSGIGREVALQLAELGWRVIAVGRDREGLAQLEEARDDGSISSKAPLLSKNLAFHLGGHTNHSIFWKNLSPNGGGEPTGELAEAIGRDFGSFEKFKSHFNAVALTLQGSGWAVLGYDHIGGRLVVQQLTDQQGNISVNLTPLLMLDMWEHAFYLQYKNVKADYVNAVWDVFNWEDVASRYAAAKA